MTWLPTTGEFGPTGGYGDFEQHDELATRIAAHYTYSEENSQGQPSTEAPENSQIRLSDGNVIFTPGLFGPDTVVTDVRYQMASFDCGLQEGRLRGRGRLLPRAASTTSAASASRPSGSDHFIDQGGQVQVSAMIQPQRLQLTRVARRSSASTAIRGIPGWGSTGFPRRTQTVRLNGEWIWVEGSPVGALTLPLTVGATGNIYNVNLEVNF